VLRTMFDRGFAVSRTWLYIPLVLFILLIVFQLVPLPMSTLSWLAPHNAANQIYLSNIGGDPPAHGTLSSYPLETAHLLRLMLVGVVVFVTVASTFRSAQQIKTLLAIVFGIGCAEAAVGIGQIFAGVTKIYGSVDIGHDRVLTAGSFVNYSHFCQFINLAIGA